MVCDFAFNRWHFKKNFLRRNSINLFFPIRFSQLFLGLKKNKRCTCIKTFPLHSFLIFFSFVLLHNLIQFIVFLFHILSPSSLHRRYLYNVSPNILYFWLVYIKSHHHIWKDVNNLSRHKKKLNYIWIISIRKQKMYQQSYGVASPHRAPVDVLPVKSIW